MKIGVTGANSAVGQALARLSIEEGIEIAACVRSAQAAKAVPSGRGISVHEISYNDQEAMARAFAGCDAVAHLAGILIEAKGSTYQNANVDTTRSVVGAAESAGVRHITLISALGAHKRARNKYLRSKGQSEEIAKASTMSSSSLRTPMLLGPGTAGAEALLRMARQPAPRVLGGGRHLLRPLDIDDLSAAILKISASATAGDHVFELVGPEEISHRALIAKVAVMLGRSTSVRSAPKWAAKVGARVARLFTRGGMSPDVIDVITSSEKVKNNADGAIGLDLTPLDATLRKIIEGEP
jgi:NADH dehydrogenase